MDKSILGTTVVTQIGIVCNDIEATTKAYAEFLGVEVPPIFITAPYEETQCEYNGKPCMARTRQSFFHVGPNVDIELLEPDQEPSVWRDWLNERGEGVHHIAFVIDGMKEKLLTLDGMGMPLMQKGEYKGGRYAYANAVDQLKTIIELLENDKK